MTPPPRSRRLGPARCVLLAAWLALAADAVVAAALVLVWLAPAPNGLPLEWVEAQIRKDEALHYRLHLTAAQLFSLCPCTRRQAAQQYERAFPHAPGVWRATALRTCQEVLAARLRPEAGVFPPPDAVPSGDLSAAVSASREGTVSVFQQATIVDASGAERRLKYSCEVRRGVAGEWQLLTLRLSE